MIRFAPYVYLHDVVEAEEMASELSMYLDNCPKDEALLYVEEMGLILADQTEEEFLFHIFRLSGEELEITDLDSITG